MEMESPLGGAIGSPIASLERAKTEQWDTFLLYPSKRAERQFPAAGKMNSASLLVLRLVVVSFLRDSVVVVPPSE